MNVLEKLRQAVATAHEAPEPDEVFRQLADQLASLTEEIQELRRASPGRREADETQQAILTVVKDVQSRAAADDPAITVAEAQRRLGCGRTTVFELLGQGTLARAGKVGRQAMITAESVDGVLEGTKPSRAAVPRMNAVKVARTSRSERGTFNAEARLKAIRAMKI